MPCLKGQRGQANLPSRPKSQRGRVDPPLCSRYRGRGVALPLCPHMPRRRAPQTENKGRAQNGPVLMRRSKDLGVRPQNTSTTQQRRSKSPTPLFSLFCSILQCGRTTQNSILTEALVFHQTLSTPKANYSERCLSGTPRGRTRKIHIFPKDPIMRTSYNTSPSHTLKFLRKYIITIPNTECGMINSRILKDNI